jgi:tRNA(Ile)-lysidine synthase TilS/MesJ
MLNLFFEGRIGCFSPVTYLSRVDLKMIRPMLYMPEKDVRYFASKVSLPVLKSPCPADGNTQREEVKKLLADLDRKHDGLRYRIFGAMQRGEIDGFHMASSMQGIKTYQNDPDEDPLKQ